MRGIVKKGHNPRTSVLTRSAWWSCEGSIIAPAPEPSEGARLGLIRAMVPWATGERRSQLMPRSRTVSLSDAGVGGQIGKKAGP